jgi:hypothetical protein
MHHHNSICDFEMRDANSALIAHGAARRIRIASQIVFDFVDFE